MDTLKCLGHLIGKAIVDERTVDFPLSCLFWKMVLQGVRALSLYDLFEFDKHYGQFMFDLKTGTAYSALEIKGMHFSFCFYEDAGLPLSEKGLKRRLTKENSREYIGAVIELLRGEAFSKAVDAFRRGLGEVLDIGRLQIFGEEEVEMLYAGCEHDQHWTVLHLKEALVASHGFTSDSETFLFLMEYMAALDTQMRKEFLKFVTGSPRLPRGGFKGLDPPLTVVEKKSCLEGELPSVMT